MKKDLNYLVNKIKFKIEPSEPGIYTVSNRFSKEKLANVTVIPNQCYTISALSNINANDLELAYLRTYFKNLANLNDKTDTIT